MNTQASTRFCANDQEQLPYNRRAITMRASLGMQEGLDSGPVGCELVFPQLQRLFRALSNCPQMDDNPARTSVVNPDFTHLSISGKCFRCEPNRKELKFER